MLHWTFQADLRLGWRCYHKPGGEVAVLYDIIVTSSADLTDKHSLFGNQTKKGSDKAVFKNVSTKFPKMTENATVLMPGLVWHCDFTHQRQRRL